MPKLPRVPAFIEATAGLALILLYIWWIQAIWPFAAVGLLALMIVADALRKATLPGIGLSWTQFTIHLRECPGPAAGFALSLLVMAAVVEHPFRLIAGALLYCVWGVIQQYLLNGFLVNRLVTAGFRGVPVIAGLVFAVLHYPNPFLMLVTFAGGIAASLVYLRFRDLLLLGMAHGLIGTVLFVIVPDSITHDFNIGPDCVAFCRQAGHRHGIFLAWTR